MWTQRLVQILLSYYSKSREVAPCHELDIAHSQLSNVSGPKSHNPKKAVGNGRLAFSLRVDTDSFKHQAQADNQPMPTVLHGNWQTVQFLKACLSVTTATIAAVSETMAQTVISFWVHQKTTYMTLYEKVGCLLKPKDGNRKGMLIGLDATQNGFLAVTTIGRSGDV